MKSIALVLALLIGYPALGETYKCLEKGKVIYTERQCAGEGGRLSGLGADATPGDGGNPKEIGKETCAKAVVVGIAFKDPDSVKLGKPFGGHTEAFEYAGTQLMARKFYVPVNAKNSYGGYIGEKSAICVTSLDGRRVLELNTLLMR
jgi:hypothetical protein